MIRLAENPGVRWCRSLPADSGFPGRGGAHNTHVQADSDLSAALWEPACPQVGKLAFMSILPSHLGLLRNGTCRSIPNVSCVFGNCSIAGEFSRASDV